MDVRKLASEAVQTGEGIDPPEQPGVQLVHVSHQNAVKFQTMLDVQMRKMDEKGYIFSGFAHTATARTFSAVLVFHQEGV